MTEQFYHRLEQELDSLREENLYREVRLFEHSRLNLSSNDYLCLRSHEKVLAGARRATEEYGAGSGASPLLGGFLPCHRQFLEQLLQWKNKPCGMLFNTGFLANQAVVKHLPGKHDLVLADRLIHHSVAQALRQGSARFKRYNHLDLEHLEELLERHKRDYETLFVVTESVFSMDGDYPDLHKLVAIKRRIPFVLILDEAHGTGVYGPLGAGLAEEMGVEEDVDILVGTLGKALASAGAYVLARSPRVVEFLTNFAGEYIYSTFLTPGQVGAASAAVKIVRQGKDKRMALRSLAKEFRSKLAVAGFGSNHYDSPIVPVIVGEAGETIRLRELLLERGFLTGAVRPPTVPKGTSRLRISLHSAVKPSHLDEILAVLKQWKKK